MTESITRIRGTGGPSPFGIMLTLLKIRLLFSSLHLLLSLLHLPSPIPPLQFLSSSCGPPFNLFPTYAHKHAHPRTYTHLSLSFPPCLLLSSSSSSSSSVMRRDGARLSLSLPPPRPWNIICRPTLTFGLLCNQNNNNCFGTFDYSSIRVTADCPKLRVGIADPWIRI